MTELASEDKEWIRRQPKAELHRHLEGSIPFQTLWVLQNQGVLPTNYKSTEGLKEGVSITNPMYNLNQVLNCFGIFQKSFKTCDHVFEVTKAVMEQAISQNIDLLELRFSPQFMAECYDLNWDEMMESVISAKKTVCDENPNFKVGFIAIVSRSYGAQSGIDTADFTGRFREHFCGFDFAEDEIKYSPLEFVETVKKVHAMDLPLTVHTGEGTSCEYIKKTIEAYNPKRLGHAVSLEDDPKLMDYCAQNKICVESCPTSNIITNSAFSYEDHPIRLYLDRGVPVCINTDDPTAFACELNEEWERGMSRVGLSRKDLMTLDEYAREHSFL